jgi:hypothetical protein
MYRILLPALLFVALTAMPSGVSLGQVSAQLGPRIGVDVNDVEAFSVGAELRLDIESWPVDLATVFDYYLKDVVDIWQLSFNALYPIAASESVRPYVGAGLGFAGGDAPDLLGVNILGGAIFTAGTLRPFAQIQFTAGNPDLFAFSGGLLFNIGN